MSKRKTYNPEKRAWRGKSYKQGRKPIKELRDKQAERADGPLQTRITKLGNGNYGVRILVNGQVYQQNNESKDRLEAAQMLKSMLRWIDKLGGQVNGNYSRMASKSRDRNCRPSKYRVFP